MALIDLSNYDTTLAQSTVGRSGTPSGNIFFDVTNGRVELITAEEEAYVDLTNAGTPQGTANVVATGGSDGTWYIIISTGGSDYTQIGASDSNPGTIFQHSTGSPGGSGTMNELTANPLLEDDGIKFEALYAFERQERRTDEALRKFDFFFAGSFKFAGAYELVNGRKFDDADGSATSLTTDDRFKLRGSGWSEKDTSGAIGRIYYGSKSLGAIEALSQPFYQLSDGGAPVNFDKDGPVDEAIEVFGNATVDTDTTTFDTRTYLSNKVRTFGNNYDEKSLADSGVAEMGGYSTGFALGESVHLTTGSYTLADVYGGSQVTPWTGMSLEELDSAQTETGFNEADGDFTWVLNNTVPGNLDQMVAFLDALAQTDDDINDHVSNTTNGKRVGTWYTYNASGQIVTRSGADTNGLFLENVPTADQQRVVFTDDGAALKTYPFSVSVGVTVGANAVADTNAWYHAFFLDGPSTNDFNTAAALTVEDSSSALVKGVVNVDHVSNVIEFTFDYDGDTIGGTAGTEKDVVFECEGDGGVTAAKTVFTISRTQEISVTCIPSVENNV
jgi:hypothetical protein